MMTIDEMLSQVTGIDREELDVWVACGCVHPIRRGGRMTFRDVDVARLRLIVEIRDDFDVRRENIPLVLSLIDQVHGLRAELRALATAIDAQPDEVRGTIRRHLAGPTRGETPRKPGPGSR